ncbi:SMC domain protein [Shewanella baltica OS625]|uniref:anti-phage protein Ppl n=1 Tax=Shewanella baltica TaxID=62322 RepID=UPI000230D984|nr:anti-phage protein Ppl [Shewanella baltica]EHC04425.1 SMC domain protein [Shewanella baltica OS625]
MYGTDWYKIDFHCHSPESDDYRESVAVTAREWLLAYMQAGIDAVILSDHNTGAFVDKAKSALDELKAEFDAGEHNGYRPLSVFPSVELTATGNIHVLGIFPEHFDSEKIAGVVGECGKPLDKLNHTLVLRSGVEQCLDIIKNNTGLAVLAHVDRPKGLLQTEKNLEAIRQIFEHKIDAIELKGDLQGVDSQKKVFIENKPLIIGSDSHERSSAGSFFTWVKMSAPNFDGLKTALADHEYSVLRSIDGNPPSQPINRVDEIRIQTTTCSVGGSAVTVGFSPWYNAIIGSRGSGKSTVVEYIRYALGLDGELPKDIKSKYQKFVGNTIDQNSTIELDYYKDNQKYLIKASPLERIVEFEDSDAITKRESFSSQRFPVSIYSQKMLFEIANASNAFLRIVDQSKMVDFDSWFTAHKMLVDEYDTLFSQVERLKADVTMLNIHKSEYGDINLSIERVQDSDYSRLVQEKEFLDKEKGFLDQFIKGIQTSLDNVEQACDESTFEFTEAGYILDSVTESWISDAHDLHIDFSKNIKVLIDCYRARVDSLIERPPYTINSEKLELNTISIKQCVELLNEKGTSPDRLIELVSQRSVLTDKIRVLSASEIQLVNIRILLEKKYEQLVVSRQELTDRRQHFIDDLNIENLKIKVLPLGEPEDNLISGYQQAVGFESFTEHIYDISSEKGLLSHLVKIEKRNPKLTPRVYEVLTELKKFHINTIDNMKSNGLHASFAKKLSELTTDRLRALNTWFPEDGIFIQFKREDDSWSNLEDASPGQQSASMLSFLLSYGDEPIIIDQPEDDLDCAMLSTNVIPNIRKNKSRRQLILVTHSAPLVVNGDAENVISMKFNKGKVTVGQMGAIQDQDMKDLICKQMEGGKDAFKSRYSRLTN